MRRVLFGVAAALLAAFALAAGSGRAQFLHHRSPPAANVPTHVDCDALAANPAIGMDQASCEAMNQAEAAYVSAKSDPEGARPGDEAMSCADIKAEFMGQPVTAPSAEHEATARAATSDYMAKSTVIQHEAAAMEAKESAEELGASAAEMANPLAGKAASSALAAQEAAEHAALNAKAKAELTPAMKRVTSSTADIAGDMAGQLQSNPRIAHLVALSQEKRCHGF